MKTATQAQAIKKLNEAFPTCGATDLGKFYGRPHSGIWFRPNEESEVLDFNRWPDTFGSNPEIEALLDAMGWCSEPYDAGTLHAFEL